MLKKEKSYFIMRISTGPCTSLRMSVETGVLMHYTVHRTEDAQGITQD